MSVLRVVVVFACLMSVTAVRQSQSELKEEEVAYESKTAHELAGKAQEAVHVQEGEEGKVAHERKAAHELAGRVLEHVHAQEAKDVTAHTDKEVTATAAQEAEHAQESVDSSAEAAKPDSKVCGVLYKMRQEGRYKDKAFTFLSRADELLAIRKPKERLCAGSPYEDMSFYGEVLARGAAFADCKAYEESFEAMKSGEYSLAVIKGKLKAVKAIRKNDKSVSTKGC